MTSRGHNNFLVPEAIPTPTSDVTDDTSSGDDASSYNASTGGDHQMEQRLYVINRAGSGEASYLLVSPDRQHITSYRLRTEVWSHIVDVTNFGVAVLHNFLYVIGGFDRRHATHLNRVLRYDPAEGTWAPCAPLLCARAKFGICTSGTHIYVCGGEKCGGKVTKSCEMYDLETDTWTKIGVLPQPRAYPVCAAHRKELFCVGGYHGNTAHKNLWLYEDHRWGEVDDLYPHTLPSPLDRCAVTVHDNTLYFLGGVSSKQREHETRAKFITQRHVISYAASITALGRPPGPESLSSSGITPRTTRASEKSNVTPRASDLISPWNLKLPPMNHARHSAGAVTLGHKIYVVGGSTLETGQQVRIAEYMDTRTGLWEDDFNFRKGDVSNVACTLLAVPKIPVAERKMAYRLKWVMW